MPEDRSVTTFAVTTALPGRAPGQDTVEALTDWGIAPAAIDKLLDGGVITQAEPA